VNKILVVDDDRSISEVLRLYLSFEGFDVIVAGDGKQALELFTQTDPQLLILDLMLPHISGYDVCRTIRQTSQVPILMLTAKDTTEDKLQGFALGADDYLIKPFDPKEAVARVRALLRRSTGQAAEETEILRIGALEVNLQAYEVRLSGQPIPLKPREIQLLYFLLTNPNHVFTREQLLEHVWGYDYAGETRTVDVHIMRLRGKVEGEASPIHIRTVRGIGYKLEVAV
jgi:DNA-binding response OmpR family regulator